MLKDKILNVILVLLVVTLIIQCVFSDDNTSDRYQIITADNMLTILLDKQTGETWRNCMCSKENQVPGCWEKMHTIDVAEFNLPVGEKITRKKELKLIAKIKKEQEKTQQTKVEQVKPQDK